MRITKEGTDVKSSCVIRLSTRMCELLETGELDEVQLSRATSSNTTTAELIHATRSAGGLANRPPQRKRPIHEHIICYYIRRSNDASQHQRFVPTLLFALLVRKVHSTRKLLYPYLWQRSSRERCMVARWAVPPSAEDVSPPPTF
ncbi:hypothetical protein HAX54_004272 [Datura stramonium]|uniref:Uncharacterized protein n=1 Tax=Datura stramonium TaxID=4076 RepID=A0ABS8WSU6_DATST|nr:hypothetical protein [Datura stramonium]